MTMKTKTRSTFAVLFYIDKSKAKKKSKERCIINGRITINAQIARFSTNGCSPRNVGCLNWTGY